jgi:hypothetical protein
MLAIIPRRFLAAILMISLASTIVTACEFADPATIELELGFSALNPFSTDRPEQAAFHGAEALQDIKLADRKMADALASFDGALVDEAVALRPVDPFLRYQRAVFGLAEDSQAQDYAGSLGRALGTLKAAYPGLSDEDLEAAHNEMLGTAALRVMANYPKDSDSWKLLHDQYCKTTSTKIDVLGILENPANPPEACL